MSQPVDNGHKLVEWIMASLTGATVLGLLHWLLGVPAAVYYAIKAYRLYKDKKARE